MTELIAFTTQSEIALIATAKAPSSECLLEVLVPDSLQGFERIVL